MVPTLLFKSDTVWRPHRRTHDNYTVKPSKTGGRRWRSYRAPPIVATAMRLFLALLLVGIGPARGVEPSAPPAERCPCPEITVADILETRTDGECVDVPHVVTFRRESNHRAYIASVYTVSRNLCRVSDPSNRKVEWTAIEMDGEFDVCRNVILTAADTLGIPCTDIYHPTPSRERPFGSPGS